MKMIPIEQRPPKALCHSLPDRRFSYTGYPHENRDRTAPNRDIGNLPDSHSSDTFLVDVSRFVHGIRRGGT